MDDPFLKDLAHELNVESAKLARPQQRRGRP
jgi:hypothetical protein